MMAFFLLMWLLGSTTEGDKKGIADFFNAPLKVSLLGGSGSGDSSHVIRGGGTDLSRQHRAGEGRRDRRRARKTINLKALKAEQRGPRSARLEALKEQVEDAHRGIAEAGDDEVADPPRHDAATGCASRSSTSRTGRCSTAAARS